MPQLPWKELDRERVLDTYTVIDKVMFKLPDGAVKDMYLKIQKPAACILALTADNDVILEEQFRPGPNKVLLELPGGFIEPGEDALGAAARELREETGYEGQLQFVTDCIDDAYSTMVRSCFVATNCVRVADQTLDDSEFMNVRLVRLDEFRRILRSGQMTDVEMGYLGLDKLGLL